jgi:small subunit ribosomal protein S1
MRQGELITAEVTRVDYNIVVVNAGLRYPKFHRSKNSRTTKVSSSQGRRLRVTVAIGLEDGYGETRLSRDKAKRPGPARPRSRDGAGTVVSGPVTGAGQGRPDGQDQRPRVSAGLAGRHPSVKDTTPFEGKALDFKVIKLDRKRNNVVVSAVPCSRRALAERDELLKPAGRRIVKGIVKTSPIGAASSICGIDGLPPTVARRRVKHPSEVLAVGDEVTAKVLKFDQERTGCRWA